MGDIYMGASEANNLAYEALDKKREAQRVLDEERLRQHKETEARIFREYLPSVIQEIAKAASDGTFSCEVMLDVVESSYIEPKLLSLGYKVNVKKPFVDSDYDYQSNQEMKDRLIISWI